MCNNGLFGGDSITWVLIILIVLLGCGGRSQNYGCGC